jgi:ATP-dependent RNA helicase MSS116
MLPLLGGTCLNQLLTFQPPFWHDVIPLHQTQAGKSGESMLLLCDFERFFLQDLLDLPVQAYEAPAGFPAQHAGIVLALGKVDQNGAARERAEQAYQAWLGFYKGLMRRMKMAPYQLVDVANAFSREMGLKNVPYLQAKTVGKMGLKGTPGLKVKF